MALDEAISVCVRKGHSPPTLRLYGWETPSASIGYFQRSGELDLSYCSEQGIDVVRRPTGGRGILHRSELTYSFCSPGGNGHFSGPLMESYWKIGMAFLRAFRALGLQAEASTRRISGRPRSPLCFSSHSYGEITVKGKKITGSAQRRWPDGFLQQGSIPFEINRTGLMRVFRGYDGTAGDSLAGLGELMPGLDPASLRRAVTGAFENEFDIAFNESGPGPDEDTLARDLLEARYLRAEWNFLR